MPEKTIKKEPVDVAVDVKKIKSENIDVIKSELDSTVEPAEEPTHIKAEEPGVSTKSEIKSEEDADESVVDRITSLATLNPYLAKQCNWENYEYMSDIPQICKDEPCMLGIDEAGRGPVLGPMVYGIAFCPLIQAAHLKTLGCADSKQLSEKDREKIFDDLCVKEYANTNVGWAIDVISPSYISQKMLSRVKVSLNQISMDSAIGLVNKAIDAGVNIAEVYVDTVGPPEKYQAKLSALFPDFQITVAKKADSTYPIVSAASICAKVTRDHALQVWKFPEGLTTTYEEFGSGYPGDPKTKAFLENNVDRVFGFPRIVRFSWSTAVNVLKRKALPMEFDDTDADTDKRYKASSRSIKKFLKPDDANWYVPCRFFRERCISHCVDI